MVRILIADSHRASRDVIRALLQIQADFEVIGEADNGVKAIAMFKDLRPDILVIDSELSGMKAIQATQHLIQHSTANIVILSSHSNEAYAAAAMEAGAKAWIQKERTVEELACAIRKVMGGDTYLGLPLTQEAIDVYRRQTGETPFDPYGILTGKERQMLMLISSGWSFTEIGDRLYMSQRTVKRHRAKIMRKLGLTTDDELARYSAERVVPPPEP